jgi:hypothetical protein
MVVSVLFKSLFVVRVLAGDGHVDRRRRCDAQLFAAAMPTAVYRRKAPIHQFVARTPSDQPAVLNKTMRQ